MLARYFGTVDIPSAKVLGTIALVFSLVFIATSIVRLTRPEVDVLLVTLNTSLGIFRLTAGVWLWRFALRKAKRGR